jgi:protocatechuate 3,4-dioxygenase beta subunit
LPIKHPALALIALSFSLILAACSDTPQPANNGTPAEVFSLATVGVSGDDPIATLSDAESTASFGTPSGEQDTTICQSTPSDDEGTYFLEGAPRRDSIAPEDAPGDPLIISGFIYIRRNSTCTPLANAVIDVWQADSTGDYDTSSDFLYRGKLESDKEGRYTITTIIPGASGDDPPAIYIRITHSDAAPLITRLFLDDGSDPSRTLVLSETNSGYTSRYDFVLPAK